MKKTISKIHINRIALPIVSLLFLVCLYFVNVKPVIGNISLLNAIKFSQTPGETSLAIKSFQKSYNAGRLGRPEITERSAAALPNIVQSEISNDEKNIFFIFSRDALLKEVEVFDTDARLRLLTGSFLSSVGLFDEALVHLNRARELMPGKQQMYLEIANVFLHQEEYESSIKTLEYLGEISPDHKAEVDEYIGQIRGLMK
jgi:tetratricopeptide (TPR) repeat protein